MALTGFLVFIVSVWSQASGPAVKQVAKGGFECSKISTATYEARAHDFRLHFPACFDAHLIVGTHMKSRR
jgi:hypothetical protein